MKYEINTTTHGGLLGIHVVQVSHDLHEEVRTTITRQVIDTWDETVRAALCKLGWTPPPTGFVEVAA